METTDTQDKTQLIINAQTYLRDARRSKPGDAESIWTLAKDLIRSNEFGWGRRLLDMLAEFDRYPSDSKDAFVQKRALAT